MRPNPASRPARRGAALAASPAVLLALLIGACGGPNAEPPEPPARVEHPVEEAQLNTITLTEQAAQRLGIETAVIESTSVERYREVGGEVVVPFEREITIAAPAAGRVLPPAGGAIPPTGSRVHRGEPVLRLVFLPGGGDLARVREQVAVAEAKYATARAEAERADTLLRRQVITQREHDLARAAFVSAEAELRSALAQRASLEGGPESEVQLIPLTLEAPRDGILWQVWVSAGQTVAPGLPLFEVVSLDPVWIRASIYAGDLRGVARARPALVRDLGQAGGVSARSARPIAAPPSANASASAVDLYFELPNPSAALRPGQRVAVSLPLAGSERGLVVPRSAILYDIQGGAWIYEQVGPFAFARRRVELKEIVGDRAVLARGPGTGARIVITGAAELYGTEFGAAH